MKQNVQPSQTVAQSDFDISNTDLIFKLTAEDLLLDLKVLIKEYYCGTFTKDSKSLKLQFTNGQSFLLSINEN